MKIFHGILYIISVFIVSIFCVASFIDMEVSKCKWIIAIGSFVVSITLVNIGGFEWIKIKKRLLE